MKIGWAAVGLGASTFIVPFIFVYSPELLGEGSLLTVLWACVTAVVGVTAISAASIGFIAVPLRWFERILLSVGGLALVIPGIITDMMGFAIFSFILFRNLSLKKRRASLKAKPGG